MATPKDREDLFLGKGKFTRTPFYKAPNRTTGVTRVNDLLKDTSLRASMSPYDISKYKSIFECIDIDLLVKLHNEIVKRPEDDDNNNLLSSVLHTYIYMLCIIDEFGIDNAYANRSKYETTTGKLTWKRVQQAIDDMKKRNSISSSTTGVSSTPSVSAPTATPSVTLSSIAQKCKELLEANHNIILSGAPGTGKTYMAKQIALAMTGSEDRIGFVQFHPSYDYTDFVEGLRPTSASGSTIGFERKDGIFKEFCEKAIVTKASLKKAYDELVDDIRNGKVISITTYGGVARTARISTKGLISLPNPLNYGNIETLANTYPTKDDLDKVGPNRKAFDKVIGGSDSTAYWAVLNELYIRITSKPYIFIIDEINRGEMSKVFGELFFSIDPGYRGIDGKVRTQYANMVSTPNAFDKVLGKTNPKDLGYFFVPENVYIIGTMNDIDRSVDSMDFAMRRRFMIKEIKASDTQKEMLTNAAVIAKMDALNNIIEGVSPNKIKAKLGSSYALGASYFKKYDLYTSDSFKALWDNHLEGILREYLRGTQDPDNDLKVLKEAYENA